MNLLRPDVLYQAKRQIELSLTRAASAELQIACDGAVLLHVAYILAVEIKDGQSVFNLIGEPAQLALAFHRRIDLLLDMIC
jgi:hypothetical protein